MTNEFIRQLIRIFLWLDKFGVICFQLDCQMMSAGNAYEGVSINVFH